MYKRLAVQEVQKSQFGLFGQVADHGSHGGVIYPGDYPDPHVLSLQLPQDGLANYFGLHSAPLIGLNFLEIFVHLLPIRGGRVLGSGVKFAGIGETGGHVSGKDAAALDAGSLQLQRKGFRKGEEGGFDRGVEALEGELQNGHDRRDGDNAAVALPAIQALQNPNVKSVTVVEYDQKIIDIFNKHIRPLLKTNKELKIIKDDAFHYLKNNDVDKLYNYLFIDIWHNPEDGLPLYLRFLKQLKSKKINVSYWLEKSILAMYRRCLLTIVEENLEGYKKEDYLKAETDYDRIINDLYFKTENLVIDSYDKLLNLLQDNSLKKLV